MNSVERRKEIMLILNVRRHETMQVLASELGVTDRTIRNDITILTAEYPLQTSRGIYGGVSLPDWFRLNKNLFSEEETTILEEMLSKADEHQSQILKQLLARFGPNTYRHCKA